MSMVTITLDNWSKFAAPDAVNLQQRINAIINNIFDFNVPWYLEGNTGLEEWKRMFVIKFWEREIGFGTTDLFKLKLWELMARKMPYYRLIAEQQGLIGDIFINIDETTTDERTNTTDSAMQTSKNVGENINETNYAKKENSGSLHGESDENGQTGKEGNKEFSETGKAKDVKSKQGEKNNEGIENEESKNEKNISREGEKKENEEMTTDNENTNEKNENTKNDTKENSKSDLQGLTSENPQITIADNDYANQLQRNETINSGSKSESLDGRTVTSIKETKVMVGNKNANETSTESEGRNESRDKTSSSNESFSESETTDSDNTKITNEENKENTSTVNKTENSESSESTEENTGNKDQERTMKDNTDSTELRQSEDKGKTNINGWRGSRSDEYRKFAESIRNINEMLLDDCNILFLGILQNPWADSFPMKEW